MLPGGRTEHTQRLCSAEMAYQLYAHVRSPTYYWTNKEVYKAARSVPSLLSYLIYRCFDKWFPLNVSSAYVFYSIIASCGKLSMWWVHIKQEIYRSANFLLRNSIMREQELYCSQTSEMSEDVPNHMDKKAM